MTPGNVLMVCLGNICRSPLAHGIFEHHLNNTEYLVDSAGTSNYHIGGPPDPRSIQTAQAHQIDISQQKARQFTVKDFDRFDYIYVMDRQNLANVLALATTQSHQEKVQLLLDTEEVEDPYYGGTDGFEIVFQKIEKACKQILSKWKH